MNARIAWITVIVGMLLMTEAEAQAYTRHGGGNGLTPTVGVPDHDDALAARARGEIKSFDEILQILKPRQTDRLVDVVIDKRGGRWIYELTFLTKLGRYRIFTLDAKDGVILKDETK